MDSVAGILRCLRTRLGLSEHQLRLDHKAISQLAHRISEQRGITPHELLAALEHDDQLLSCFATVATVGETYFLRHPKQFDFITQHLSRRLTSSADQLRILSAGCSSGEEPYSVAIMLHEALGRAAGAIAIAGCDVNPQAISSAETACYSSWSFRGVPPWFLAKYFTPSASPPGCRLIEEIARRVTFHRQSIQEHLRLIAPASLDIVLFRNVGIYLRPEALDNLFMSFVKLLKPDGLLLVAPGDPRPPKHSFHYADDDLTVWHRNHAGCPQPSLDGEYADNPHKPGARSAKGRSPHRLARSIPPARRLSLKSPPEAAAAPAPAAEDLAAQARQLADSLLREAPTDKSAYFLRGQILLCQQCADSAIDDFRRVIFLDPTDALARYWYVIALRQAGRADKVADQLAVLDEALATQRPTLLLQDGETTVAHLKESVRHLKKGIRHGTRQEL